MIAVLKIAQAVSILKVYKIGEIECSHDEMAWSNKKDNVPAEGQYHSQIYFKEIQFQTQVMQFVLFYLLKVLEIDKTDQ